MTELEKLNNLIDRMDLETLRVFLKWIVKTFPIIKYGFIKALNNRNKE